MLDRILWHLKATYVTSGFAALAHLFCWTPGQETALQLAQAPCEQLCISALTAQEI